MDAYLSPVKTTAALAGQAIAKAVAAAENFDAATLRNHAHAVMGAAGTPDSALAFATQLHTTLVVLALLAEER